MEKVEDHYLGSSSSTSDLPLRYFSCPELMDIYYEYFIPLSDLQLRRLSEKAVNSLDVRLVSYLAEFYTPRVSFTTFFDELSIRADFEMGKTIIELGKIDVKGQLCDVYVGGGVAFCEYLKKKGGRFSWEAYLLAASLFNSNVFQFLEKEGIRYDQKLMDERLQDMFVAPGVAKSVSDLKFFFERNIVKVDSYTLSNVGGYRKDFIEYLLSIGAPWGDSDEAVSETQGQFLNDAMYIGDPTTLKYLLDIGLPITSAVFSPFYASREPGLYTFLPLLEKYLPKKSWPFPEKDEFVELVEELMKHGHRRLFKWLAQKGPYESSDFPDGFFDVHAPWYRIHWDLSRSTTNSYQPFSSE